MPSGFVERDWRFMMEAIYRINSQASIWDMEMETLKCLQQFISSTQGTFFIYDGACNDGTPNLVDSTAVVGDDARYLDQFMTGRYDHDRYFTGLLYFRNEPVFRDSDLMPDAFRTESKLYREIYEPQGIYWGLRAYLTYKDRLLGNISIFNSFEKGDFSDRDVRILRLMEPHLSLKLWELQTEELHAKGEKTPDQDLYDLAARFSLTMREKEVLALILSGKDDREVAQALSISFSTFKKHVGNIYKKMKVNNRVQLFKEAKGTESPPPTNENATY